MRFSMELEVIVEADNSEEAEAKILTALDPITTSCDISDGPFEVEEAPDEEDEEPETETT